MRTEYPLHPRTAPTNSDHSCPCTTDRPYPGYSEVDNLLKYADQGGFVPALENLFRTGNPLVQAIIKNWSAWENGVPQA